MTGNRPPGPHDRARLCEHGVVAPIAVGAAQAQDPSSQGGTPGTIIPGVD